MIPEVTVADLLTLVGLTPVVVIFTELVKRTLALTEAATKRWGPGLSIGSGILLALAAGGWLMVQGNIIDVGQTVLTGFVAGSLAAGLYDVAGEQIGTLIAKVTGGRVT
jgi:hypothetical protein